MTTLTRFFRHFVRLEAGSTAAEFALVAPFMFALILFAFNAGLMMYSGAMLNFAVADAARCGVVRATCQTGGVADATKTQTYAQKQYGGFTTARAFTPNTTATCGVQVNATATYTVMLGIASFGVPMEATACYPLQPTA